MDSHLSLQTILQEEYNSLDYQDQQRLSSKAKEIIFNSERVKPKAKRRRKVSRKLSASIKKIKKLFKAKSKVKGKRK